MSSTMNGRVFNIKVLVVASFFLLSYVVEARLNHTSILSLNETTQQGPDRNGSIILAWMNHRRKQMHTPVVPKGPLNRHMQLVKPAFKPTLNPKPSIRMNNTMTDGNIKSAAYQWVSDNDYAMAAYGDISYWDTSRVTSMWNVFGYCNPDACTDYYNCVNGCPSWQSGFTADLSRWDTSRVTEMFAMFSGAFNFNSDLATWDTSHVTSMVYMFYATFSFDQILCWNTSLANTDSMFDAGSSGSLSPIPYPGCLTAMPTMKPLEKSKSRKSSVKTTTKSAVKKSMTKALSRNPSHTIKASAKAVGTKAAKKG